jgi:hypothetical protein
MQNKEKESSPRVHVIRAVSFCSKSSIHTRLSVIHLYENSPRRRSSSASASSRSRSRARAEHTSPLPVLVNIHRVPLTAVLQPLDLGVDPGVVLLLEAHGPARGLEAVDHLAEHDRVEAPHGSFVAAHAYVGDEVFGVVDPGAECEDFELRAAARELVVGFVTHAVDEAADGTGVRS